MSNAEEKPLNVYQRVNEVRKEVEYIKKDAIVQGYSAVTHDMVTARLRDSLIKHGLLVVPSVLSSEVIQTQTANGKPKIRYQAKYEMAVINIANPSDCMVMIIESHADDQGDKAPGKGISYAKKYALLKLFDLETGDNDESRVEDDRRGYTENQKATFDEIVSSKDAVAMHLLSQTIDEVTYTGLFNSFPKGEKSKGKELVRQLEHDGYEFLKGIEKSVETGDTSLAAESCSGLTHTGKALVRRHLGREGFDNLTQLLDEANRNNAA
ncbi:MAG: ERF family protein [Candidatus Thiodiazotropha endolucinida]